MANNVSVQVSANVQGFEQGMNKATESARQYETETRKISESTVNFNKQFREAKKTVKDLAASYAALSQAEKSSAFGKEMAKQLNEAKQRAAEMVDMAGDLNLELKNLASDTHTLDMVSEGFGVIADTAASAMGVIAQFTGREEDAKKAVVAFTTAQSALGAITKLQNALQMQSNTMMAVTKVQTLAAAAAENIKTAATGKGVVATKAATAAQAALNLVAKANPYVLLATAVLAVGAAMVAYAFRAQKAEDASKKLNKEMHDASIQGQKDAQAEIVKVNLLYEAATNDKLGKEQRLKAAENLQKLYPAYFSNMSKEQIMLGQASQAYKQLAQDIIAVAKAKAYEQKITEIQSEIIDLEDQKKQQDQVVKTWEKTAKDARNAMNTQISAQGVAGVNTSATNYDRVNSKLKEEKQLQTDISNKIKEKNKAADEYANKVTELQPNQNRMDANNDLKGKGGSGGSKGGGSGLTEIKAAVGSIEELENEISKLQSLAKKGALPKELQDPVAYSNKIKQLQATLKELKIKWGFEEPEKAKTKLEQLEDKVKQSQTAFVLAVDVNDKDAQAAALKAYYAAEKELKDYKLSIEIEPLQDPAEIEKQKKSIQDIVSEALNPKEEKSFNFSFLPENVAPEAEKLLEEYNRLAEAREKLNEIMNNPESTDTQISAAQAGLDQLSATFDQITEKVDFFQEWSDAIEDAQKKTEKLSQTVKGVGDAVSAAGDLFSALGEAADNEGMQALGIVAKAVATVALSFAQALTTCKTWYEWLAFGISGAATMVSMISQIKSLTSGYAQGGPVGMIGGSSYNGDNMLIRVNSGEAIINQRQQKRLFDILDGKALPNNGGSGRVEVTGVIRGTDLLLVQKNANKKLSKAGNSINIG